MTKKTKEYTREEFLLLISAVYEIAKRALLDVAARNNKIIKKYTDTGILTKNDKLSDKDLTELAQIKAVCTYISLLTEPLDEIACSLDDGKNKSYLELVTSFRSDYKRIISGSTYYEDMKKDIVSND